MVVPFILALVLNIGAGFVLIKTYGPYGALVASALAYVFLFIALVWSGRRVFKMPFPLMPFVKTLIATGLMILCLTVFEGGSSMVDLAVMVLSGFGVYALAFGALNFRLVKSYVSR